MKLRYLGPLGEVRLERGPRLPRGEAVEVPDAIGLGLTTTRPEEFEAVTEAAPKRARAVKGDVDA